MTLEELDAQARIAIDALVIEEPVGFDEPEGNGSFDQEDSEEEITQAQEENQNQ